MVLAERNCHRESAASPGRAGHIDCSTMKPGQFPHERQPDSSAFKCSPSRAFHAVESLENARKLFPGYAGPGVSHRKLYSVSSPADANYNASLKREFESIGEKIQHDLLPHVAVYVHSFRNGLAFNRKCQPRLLHRRSEDAADLLSERAQVDRLIHRLEAPGLDAREVKKRVDELQEPESIAVCDDQLFMLVGAQTLSALRQYLFERAQHEGERRPEFVAHVGEETRLGAVQFSQSLSASALSLVGD